MTDLEITRLCAEAMNIAPVSWGNGEHYITIEGGAYQKYDPLHDDAQAMGLVKKFELDQRRFIDGNHKAWIVMLSDTVPASSSAYHVDLNRAICETVAKMQQAKAVK